MSGFQIVRLRGRRLHMLLLDGRAVHVASVPAVPGALLIDRIEATGGEERLDGTTLYAGAFTIRRLIEHLADQPSPTTGRALHRKVCALFAGSPAFPDMLRATIRAGLGLPDVGGDTGLWLAAARRQLAWRPTGKVPLMVMQTVA